MNWEIAQAKQRFSELINAATQEPQLIYNRDRLVVAVVEAEIFQEFLAWREQPEKKSISEQFEELRQLIAEEGYSFEIPERQDRDNAFTDDPN